jgi:alkylation response protein AidB-like acyl-CoA dehydrogenase
MTTTRALSRLTPGEDQEQLRHAVRSFLERRSPEPEVRRLMETEQGYDPAVWQQCAQQLGLSGLDLPEEHGGSGATFRELAVTSEELGRALACVPYLSSAVLAAGALLATQDEQARAEHLPGIADGTVLAALAVAEADGSWEAQSQHTTAREADGGWRLTGTKSFVVDGLGAGLLLVTAHGPAGLSLFAVDGGAAGLQRQPMRALDLTRKLARVELSDVPGQLIGRQGDGDQVLAQVHDRAVVALACEQLGVAARSLEMAVAYAKERVQFGRSIGSFQAVKHRCADMAQQVEAARSSVAWAVACAADGSPDLPVAAAMAGVCASEAAVFATAENVQVHGGIGFTWEHPAHLYFRRARSNALLLGDPAAHRSRLLQRLGV